MLLLFSSIAIRKAILQTADASIDDTSIKFLIINDELSIGDGTNPALPSDFSKTITFPSTIKIDSIDYNITRISRNAFYKTKIQAIDFLGNIKEIGSSAFYECTSLVTISFFEGSTFTEIPDSFAENCDTLTGFEIPKFVRKIGSLAFKGCSLTSVDFSKLTEIGSSSFYGTDLTTVDLSSSQITKIPNSCFENCEKLKSLILNPKIDNVGDSTFKGTIIGGKIQFGTACEIGSEAFYGTQITNVEFIAPVELGVGTFSGCSMLKVVTNLEFADEIPNNCFEGTPIESTGNESGIIKLSSSLKSIGNLAFKGCTGIFKISIDANLDTEFTIGFSAFEGCKNLEFFPFDHAIGIIGNSSFSKTKIQSLSLSKGVTAIEPLFCSECSKLDSVDLSDSAIIKIPEKAFYLCEILDAILLPSGLESIDVSAFELTLLTTIINFPTSLVLIDEGAFRSTQITKLDLSNTNLDTINSYAFYRCQALTEVIFSDTLSFMDTNVFEESGIISLDFPKSLSRYRFCCFMNCEDLTRLNFGECDKLEEISYQSCMGCTSLSTLILPPNLVTIRPGALSRTAITYLKTPKSFMQPLDSMFENSDKILEVDFSESKVTYIGYGCFKNCENLHTVHIPGSCTCFKIYSFLSCPKLTNVLIGDGNLSMIEASVFRYCSGLVTIDLSGTIIDEISANAFADCTSLKSILLPSEIHSIHVSCFENCKNLTEFTFPESINRTFGSTFKNCISLRRCDCSSLATAGVITTGMFEGCVSLTEIILPPKLLEIRARAFQGSGIASISIGECPIILWEVFSCCANLRIADLRRTGVTILQTGLFESCPLLETVILPDALNTFNKTGNMFEGSTNLESIYYMGSSDIEEDSTGILDEEHERVVVYVSVNYLRDVKLFDKEPRRIQEEDVPTVPEINYESSIDETSLVDEELTSSIEDSTISQEELDLSSSSSLNEDLSSTSSLNEDLSSSQNNLHSSSSEETSSSDPQEDDDIWAATGPGTIGVAISGTLLFVAAIAIAIIYYTKKSNKNDLEQSTFTTADTTWILDPSLSNLANVGAPEARAFWNDYIEDDTKNDDADLYYFG